MCHRNSLDSSVDKESACNTGDPSLIPGSARSTGKGIGYPLQYSWASLVAQLVKNPPAMWETLVWSLGLGRSLREGKDYPLQYSGLENSMHCIVHRVVESDTTDTLKGKLGKRAGHLLITYSSFLLLSSMERTNKWGKLLCDQKIWKVWLGWRWLEHGHDLFKFSNNIALLK